MALDGLGGIGKQASWAWLGLNPSGHFSQMPTELNVSVGHGTQLVSAGIYSHCAESSQPVTPEDALRSYPPQGLSWFVAQLGVL